MSLAAEESDNEQNEIRNLQVAMKYTTELVKQLSGQLSELRDQVRGCSLHGSLQKHVKLIILPASLA